MYVYMERTIYSWTYVVGIKKGIALQKEFKNFKVLSNPNQFGAHILPGKIILSFALLLSFALWRFDNVHHVMCNIILTNFKVVIKVRF